MKLKLLSLVCAFGIFAFGTNGMAQDAKDEAPAAPAKEMKAAGSDEKAEGGLPNPIKSAVCTAINSVIDPFLQNTVKMNLNSCCTSACNDAGATEGDLRYCMQAINVYLNGPDAKAHLASNAKLYGMLQTLSSAAASAATTFCGSLSCKSSTIEQLCADVGCNIKEAATSTDITQCLAAQKDKNGKGDSCTNHAPIVEGGKMQPSLKCLKPGKSAI